MGKRASLVAEIEQIIRRYLQATPQTADTKWGIRKPWLRKARRTYAVADVRTAFQALHAAGQLSQLVLPEGHSIDASSHTA